MKKKQHVNRIAAWLLIFAMVFTSGAFEGWPGVVKVASAAESIALTDAVLYEAAYNSTLKRFASSDEITKVYSDTYKTQTINKTDTILYMDVNTALQFQVDGAGWSAEIVGSDNQAKGSQEFFGGDAVEDGANNCRKVYENGMAEIESVQTEEGTTVFKLYAGDKTTTSSNEFYVRFIAEGRGALRVLVRILNPVTSYSVTSSSNSVPANHKRTLTVNAKDNEERRSKTATTDIYSYSVVDSNGADASGYAEVSSENGRDAVFRALDQADVTVTVVTKTEPNIKQSGNEFIAITPRNIEYRKKMVIEPWVRAENLQFKSEEYNVEAGKTIDLLDRFEKDPATANDTWSWNSSDTKVATVDANGKVTGVATGKTTITVSAENENVKATCTVVVYKQATDIILMRNNVKLSDSVDLRNDNVIYVDACEDPATATEELVAEASDKDLISVEPVNTTETTNVKRFKITVEDTVTQKTTCSIRFKTNRTAESSGADGTVANISKSLQVNVYPKLTTALKFKQGNDEIKGTKIQVYTGDQYSISAESGSAPEDQIDWSYSGNEGIIEEAQKTTAVNDDTLLTFTAKKKGTISLTATARSNALISKSIEVEVLQSAEKIALSDTKATLNKGDTFTLSAAQTPENSDEKVIWKSSNDAIATVENGVVTAVAASNTPVTITAETEHTGKKATCAITVVDSKGLSLNKSALSGNLDTSVAVQATVKNNDDSTVSQPIVKWSIDKEEVASLDKTEGEKVTVTLKKVGTATLTATYGQLTMTCPITAVLPLSDEDVEVSGIEPKQEFTYLPNGKVPDINVTAVNKKDSRAAAGKAYTLTEGDGKDYVLKNSYTEGSSVGDYTISLGETGDKLYTGSRTIAYKVVKKDISDFKFPLEDTVYNGKAQQPEVKLTYKEGSDTQELVKGTDFKVTYTNNTNAGEATVKVEGTGNFTGTITETFTINPYAMEKLETVAIADQTYTGEALTPDVSLYRITKEEGKADTRTQLSKTTDFTAEYSNNVNAGTATIRVTGQGNYTGTVSVQFTIRPQEISGVSFANAENQTYTGAALKPEYIGTFKKQTIENGKDYTVTYEDNINVGTAKVTIAGKGNFTGTVNKSFRIDASDLTTDVTWAAIPDQYDCGTAMEPELDITNGTIDLVRNVDYTAKFTNNVNEGEASVEITGTGNFKGKLTKTFNIVKKDIRYPATDIEIKQLTGAELVNGKIYVNVGQPMLYLIKAVNGGVCDDIVMASYISAKDDFFEGGTTNVTDGTSATLMLVGKKPGTTQIRLLTKTGISKTIDVIVNSPATALKLQAVDEKNTKVDITDGQFSMLQNHTLQITPVFTPTDSTDQVQWSIDDTSIASISEDGVLTALSQGTVKVTATTLPSELSEGGVVAKTTITILKNEPATSITLDKKTLVMKAKETATLVATILPETNTEQIVWSSSDETVATVDSAGKVTAVGKGTAIITCSNFQNNISDTCTVTVSTPATGIELNVKEQTLKAGESIKITASLQPATAEDQFEWTSSDEKVATVASDSGDSTGNSQTATVKGIKEGKVTIKVTSKTTKKTANCTIVVSGTSDKKDDKTQGTDNTEQLAKAKIKKAKNVKGKKISVSWGKVAGAEGYQVAYGVKSSIKKAKIKSVKKTALTLSKLKKKKTYYIRVRAYKKVDGKKVPGAWSAAKKVKVKK